MYSETSPVPFNVLKYWSAAHSPAAKPRSPAHVAHASFGTSESVMTVGKPTTLPGAIIASRPVSTCPGSTPSMDVIALKAVTSFDPSNVVGSVAGGQGCLVM